MQLILASCVAEVADFLAKLTAVPANPFGPLYETEPTFDQVLNDLVAGDLEESWLILAGSSDVAFD